MIEDVRSYWRNRGKGYINEFKKHGFFTRRYFKRQELALLQVLKGLEFETVLEVGCGFGRITKLVLDNFPLVAKIKAIDISPQQIESCRSYLSDNTGKVELSAGLVQDLEAGENSYDLVFAAEVLMHIPFDEIQVVLAKMVRTARKYVINLDWHGPAGKDLQGYCFAHDYSALYSNLGIEDIRAVPVPRATLYSVGFGLDDGLKIARKHGELQQIWIAGKSKDTG